MYKETITYNDFNGLERKEDFYFNLTKTELQKMEVSKYGSLSTMLSTMANANDVPGMIEAIDNLVLKAYGEKSIDGRQFNKSDAISDAFLHSAAYDVLFNKMITNPDYLFKFIMGIVPVEMQEEMRKVAADNPEIAAVLMPAE